MNRLDRIGHGFILGIALALGVNSCTAPEIAVAESASKFALQTTMKVLAAYEGTAAPSVTVLENAGALLQTAEAALDAEEKNPTDANKLATAKAVLALSNYLLTAAPGDGKTPATSV